MPAPRLESAPCATTDRHARATHALGKAYRDVIRGFNGQFESAPDLVAYASDETDVMTVLEWAQQRNVAVIPYGGGTSVVGGIEPRGLDAYNGVISLDLSGMNRVIEVDEVSRAALVQAGAAGPQVEAQLQTAGPDHQVLPAVLRVLHCRRLGRHARGRPLRQRADAHRRPGRVDPGNHPQRPMAVTPESPGRGLARAPTDCCWAVRVRSA